MGNQERKARSTARQWWYYIGNESRKRERQEWVKNLKGWQVIPVFIGTLLVMLILVLILPFAWLYDKTR